MKKELKDNRIIYIGIGLFLWLTIGGFSLIFEYLIKDLFLILNIHPIIIIWTKLFVEMITYIVGFIIGIKIIKKTKLNELTIFRNVIILFILGQILQYFQPMLTNLYKTENYMNNSLNYYDFIENEPILNLTIYIISILNFVIVGLIIYKKR